MRLEALESEEGVVLPESVEPFDAMLSVLENGEVMAGGTLTDSIDVIL